MDTLGENVLRDAFKVVKRGGLVVSLPAQLGVQDLGDQLAPQYGVAFVLIAVHPSGEQLAEMAKPADAGRLKTHLDTIFPLRGRFITP